MYTWARRGFTLIELLVVVAIIALLLAILLPSLDRAREQGRITVCLSNMKAIAGSANTYLTSDRSNDLPWAIPFGYNDAAFDMPTFAGASEFIWGGGMPDKSQQQCAQASQGVAYICDVYKLPPRFRPLNPYIYPGVSFDEANRDNNNDRMKYPMPLPAVYKCPSDKSVMAPILGANNPVVESDTVFPSWEYWGTSYPSNWYWSNYFEESGDPNPYHGGNGPANALGIFSNQAGIKGIGWKVLAKNSGGWEGRFIIFYEALFNFVAQEARPPGYPNSKVNVEYNGWHKNSMYFSAAYKDGHADYKQRKLSTEGPGWTTWPNRPYTGVWAQY